MRATRATDPTPAPSPYAAVAAVAPPFAALRAADPAVWRARAASALRFALVAVFAAAGAAKLGRTPDVLAQFGTIENVLGVGDWLRVTTGLLELLGAVLLAARATAGVGAVLLGVVMTGAALTHVLVLGNAPTAPAVLLAALAVVAYGHRAELRVAGAFLERNL